MSLDLKTVTSLTRRYQPADFLRCTPLAHRTTPLGMGFGKTRFASPTDSFQLLYIAEDLPNWGVCEISAATPLRILDLRRDGCFQLGISTDIVGAKAQDEARDFSQALYEETDLDGILYHSRLRRRACVAVYDRDVAPKLKGQSVVELETRATLIPALRALKVNLVR